MRSQGEIDLAPLDPEDAAPAAALFAATAADGAGSGWSAAGIRGALEDGGYGFHALAPDGGAAGAILFLAAGDDIELANLAVARSARRQGLGARLLDRGLDAARARNARRILLEVAVDNAAAAALYRSRGFREVGRRRNYYQRPSGPIDAQVMALEFCRSPMIFR